MGVSARARRLNGSDVAVAQGVLNAGSSDSLAGVIVEGLRAADGGNTLAFDSGLIEGNLDTTCGNAHAGIGEGGLGSRCRLGSADDDVLADGLLNTLCGRAVIRCERGSAHGSESGGGDQSLEVQSFHDDFPLLVLGDVALVMSCAVSAAPV